MYNEIQKQLDFLEKHINPILKDLKRKNKDLKSWDKQKSQVIDELKKENERLKKKYHKFWVDNRKLRQKTKPYYKHLDRINMNKISGEDAIKELKEARSLLGEIAYSYPTGDSYGNEL